MHDPVHALHALQITKTRQISRQMLSYDTEYDKNARARAKPLKNENFFEISGFARTNKTAEIGNYSRLHDVIVSNAKSVQQTIT